MSLYDGGGTYLFNFFGRQIFGGTSIRRREEELKRGRTKADECLYVLQCSHKGSEPGLYS